MNGGSIVAIACAALVVVSGIGAIVYFVVTDDEEPKPDLALRSEFPTGFDWQEVTVRALGYDGLSRCIGLLSIADRDWKHDGIYYTSNQPGAKEILRANRISNSDYHYVGEPSAPRLTSTTKFQASTDLGLCTYKYDANIWETKTALENKRPIQIFDEDGRPFHFAQTPVRLEGGGSSGGTRFVLEGNTSVNAGDVGLVYSVFPRGSVVGSELQYRGFAPATIVGNGSFVLVFEIPPQDFQEADMVLLPVQVSDEGTNALQPADVSFQSLMRLDGGEAQVIVGATAPLTGPAPPNVSNLGGGRVFRASTLDEAQRQAEHDGAIDWLEGSSAAAFLVHNAVEPNAPPQSTRRVQDLQFRHVRTTTILDVAEGQTMTQVEVSYSWRVSKTEAQFVSGIGETRTMLPARVSGATAAVTQIGADGLRILHATKDGVSAQAAIVATHRALDAKGQALALDSALTRPVSGSYDFFTGSQKYLFAAGALATGWEWFEAAQAEDAQGRVIHGFKAMRLGLETVFSLTAQGAVIVALTNLAEFALEQLLPQEVLDTLERVVNTGFLAKTSDENSRQAFNEIAPEMAQFAASNNAGVLQPAYDKPKETPVPFASVALAILLALALRRKRTM